MSIFCLISFLFLYAYSCYKIGYHYGKADGLKEKYKSRKEANP